MLSTIKGLLQMGGRQAVRLIPILVIVGVIGWFFLLRSPGGQTTTSGTSETDTSTETATTATPTTQQTAETKVADNSTLAATTDEEQAGKADGKLPETGPADTAILFVAVTAAGTLFWEWRQRRAQEQ